MRPLWKTTSSLILILGLLVGCGESGGQADGEGENSVVLGSASQGSDAHVTSVSMADIVSRHTDIAATVQPVGGAVAIMRAVDEGDISIGMANTAAVTNAFNGKNPFENPIDVRLQLRGFNILWQLVVREDSGIETPADLEGKRLVGERPALIEVRQVTDALLKVNDVDPGSVEIIATNETNETLNALRRGTVDAAILPGSAGAGNLSELAHTADVRWMDLSANINEMLGSLGPAFMEDTIPAGTYEGQKQDVSALATAQVTTVSADVSEEMAYTITKAILENSDEIQGSNSDKWTVENALSVPPTAPFHPGAVRYFKEKGAWTDELQRIQDELLKQADEIG